MTQEAATKTRMVDPNMVPRPYPGRTELLPAGRFTPDAQWLGSLMANKYPGVVAEKLEVVQLFDSHTTKLRVAVDWNEAHALRFRAAMNDDFNTPEAYSALFDLVREINRQKGEDMAVAAALGARLRAKRRGDAGRRLH